MIIGQRAQQAQPPAFTFPLSMYGQWYYLAKRNKADGPIEVDKSCENFAFRDIYGTEVPGKFAVEALKEALKVVDEANLKMRSMLTAYFISNNLGSS